MSPLLPQIKARDLIRVVKQLGFELEPVVPQELGPAHACLRLPC